MTQRVGKRSARSFKQQARLLGLGLAIVWLPGCATVAAGEDQGSSLASISYETGPCFGACPVYQVTVAPDGRGIFEGRRFTAAVGRRDFVATPAQFGRFERHLAPLRPAAGSVHHSGETCAMMATDLPSADVRWADRKGSAQSLHFYFGCDMDKNRAIAERLREAPDLLPIAGFIKAAE